ncbi:gamma-glutamylcyclotransferase family protein [Enterovibrio calviensis]|uniref:gamma-glutamylcyclotransferase family protein n=1 Tax=Enterovibrio calviensis TaxID=91359 RepID=UPI000483527D|nr:gamma-glutamylcyclotransferase family protein [Enterovibrio calviensis]
MERLFIYGTLAPGRPNHGVVADIPGDWVAASMKGHLVNEGWGSELGCPGIVPSNEGEKVEGFLFSSSHLSQHWARLDDYEGTGYKRVPVLVSTESGQNVEAYVYALNQVEKSGL